MNTKDLIEKLSGLCERFVNESRAEKTTTKLEIQRICKELESPNHSKAFVDGRFGNHGKWIEHLYRIVAFTKGQRDIVQAKSAIWHLGQPESVA